MKAFIIAIAILFMASGAGNLSGSPSRAVQGEREPGACEAAAAELARFDKVGKEWGASNEGDPYTTVRHHAADGEWFGYGVTIYKLKSRFKRSVRLIVEDSEGLIELRQLSDEKGRRVGQRVVKERREGEATRVAVWVIMDRMIQGVDAPSLALALAAERVLITCPAEARRRLKQH
ncbi:MAG TPA: hypothetical protein VN282_23870 [Pyrinomonadaceae bacterium]|nr:hypothetical protein [Pyrinomonadaceae bacterium]